MARLLSFMIIGSMLITFGTSCIAQTELYTTAGSKKGQKSYTEALDLRKAGEPKKAADKLEELLKSEPTYVEAALKLAEWEYSDEHLPEAAAAFEYVIAVDSFLKPRTLYSLGRIYLQIGEYTRSRVLLERFLAQGAPNQNLAGNAQQYLGKACVAEELFLHPVDFEPEPVPGDVNTDNGEALPAFTVDGLYMLLTRKIKGQEDLYISYWDSVRQEWLKPESLNAVNTLQNEGAHAVAADGSLIAFTACGRQDGAGSCDLYFWQRKDGVWQRPVNAGGINTPAWDAHPALTPDGLGMYFSSERPGGLGGKDIWYTQRRGDRWTRPINLGSPVNTPGNEEAPFLYYDGRTMYFMSDGHPGLGDSDIFVTTRTGSTWSEPKNLGYPINTHHREGAFTIHPDREYAYFTSDKKDGQNDLYRFKLDSTLLPPPVSNLRGVVTDSRTGEPVIARVRVFDLKDSLEHYTYETATDGSFSSVLVHGHTFGVHATADAYAFWSGQFSLDSTSPYSRKEILIRLIPVKQESLLNERAIVLRNIEFETGSSTLLASSLHELSQLYAMLVKHTELHIEIRGHTDDVGEDADNQALSQSRARAVYEWLVARGIEASRLSSMGYGEKMPVAANENETGRQENRRVEFVILRQ